MTKRNDSIRIVLLATGALVIVSPAFAGDVTPERRLLHDRRAH